MEAAGVPHALAEVVTVDLSHLQAKCTEVPGGKTRGSGVCSCEKCYPVSFSKRFMFLLEVKERLVNFSAKIAKPCNTSS